MIATVCNILTPFIKAKAYKRCFVCSLNDCIIVFLLFELNLNFEIVIMLNNVVL